MNWLPSARRASNEAERHYRDAIEVLDVLPESPERDLRELELRQHLVSILIIMRGHNAPETLEASLRVSTLAEKAGKWRLSESIMRCAQTLMAGDLSTAAVLADEALALAVRDGNPAAMASAHSIQLVVRYYHGDLAGAENHFAVGLKFFEDKRFRANLGHGACAPFGRSSLNAWVRGQTDVARERLAMLRAAARPANPHDLQWADHVAATLHNRMREYETAETGPWLRVRSIFVKSTDSLRQRTPDVTSVMRERSSATLLKGLP